MEYVAMFAWGTVYGGDSGEAMRYGIKHANRFGRCLGERPATDADPLNPWRLAYTLTDESPARQRYLKRMHDKRHPNQPTLFDLSGSEAA